MKKDHDCQEKATYMQWLKLEQCAAECAEFMFTFKKGKCDESMKCPCYCIKAIAAVKETCTFRADSDFDVYAYKGKMSSTEVASTKALGRKGIKNS